MSHWNIFLRQRREFAKENLVFSVFCNIRPHGKLKSTRNLPNSFSLYCVVEQLSELIQSTSKNILFIDWFFSVTYFYLIGRILDLTVIFNFVIQIYRWPIEYFPRLQTCISNASVSVPYCFKIDTVEYSEYWSDQSLSCL